MLSISPFLNINIEYSTEAIHNPLNIPLAKNIWACKRRSAGVKATPIQQAPPIMPNEVAKKFNKDGLNAVLMKKKRMIKV